MHAPASDLEQASTHNSSTLASAGRPNQQHPWRRLSVVGLLHPGQSMDSPLSLPSHCPQLPVPLQPSLFRSSVPPAGAVAFTAVVLAATGVVEVPGAVALAWGT